MNVETISESAKPSQKNQNLESLIWKTETTLFGRLQATKPQIPMWLDLRYPITAESSVISLCAVQTSEDWDALKKLRTEIEIPFGVTETLEIENVISSIQRIVNGYDAIWYFALIGNEIVGEVGLVKFESDGVRYGRLLDVDIAPRFQGPGRISRANIHRVKCSSVSSRIF